MLFNIPARAFTILSALAAVASAGASKTITVDDDVFRNLVEKVAFLESESDALKSEVAALKKSSTNAPQDIKHLRRALEEDAAGTGTEGIVGNALLYAIHEKLEALEECVGYDSAGDICYFGGPDTNEVIIQADQEAYFGLGNGSPGNNEGIRMTSSDAGQIRIFSADGRIDIDAGTNVEIKADVNQGDAVNGFAWIGTVPGDGNNGQGAYFRAFGGGTQSAAIVAQSRIDIDVKTGTNLEYTCNGGPDKNLCNLPNTITLV